MKKVWAEREFAWHLWYLAEDLERQPPTNLSAETTPPSLLKLLGIATTSTTTTTADDGTAPKSKHESQTELAESLLTKEVISMLLKSVDTLQVCVFYLYHEH